MNAPSGEGDGEPDDGREKYRSWGSSMDCMTAPDDHAGEAEHGAVGKVDAPGEDHEGLPDGQEQELDGVLGGVQPAGPGEQVVVGRESPKTRTMSTSTPTIQKSPTRSTTPSQAERCRGLLGRRRWATRPVGVRAAGALQRHAATPAPGSTELVSTDAAVAPRAGAGDPARRCRPRCTRRAQVGHHPALEQHDHPVAEGWTCGRLWLIRRTGTPWSHTERTSSPDPGPAARRRARPWARP